MGLWARTRKRPGRPPRALVEALAEAHRDELRMASQLRLHTERLPYADLAAPLLGLSDRETAHADLLRAELTRLGAPLAAADGPPARNGRNYWQRLAIDHTDLRANAKRYLELAERWDDSHPETAALFVRIAREESTMCRILRDMIARADPHAEDLPQAAPRPAGSV